MYSSDRVERVTNERNQIVPVVQDELVVSQRESATIRLCELKGHDCKR